MAILCRFITLSSLTYSLDFLLFKTDKGILTLNLLAIRAASKSALLFTPVLGRLQPQLEQEQPLAGLQLHLLQHQQQLLLPHQLLRLSSRPQGLPQMRPHQLKKKSECASKKRNSPPSEKYWFICFPDVGVDWVAVGCGGVAEYPLPHPAC